MRSFGRHGSTASSDTYASCPTHPQSSPSPFDIGGDSGKHNVYVNPLDQALNTVHMEESPPNGGKFTRPCRTAIGPLASDQIVQKLNDGLTATWHLAPPFFTPEGHRKRANSRGSESSPSPLKQALRRNKSLGIKPKARFTDGDSMRSHSSSDSINSQGSVKSKGLRFKPFAGRFHGSSPTGQKLANYQLINANSGEFL